MPVDPADVPTELTELPTRWTPIAAASTGVQPSEPTFASAPVLGMSVVLPAAGFKARAFASVPPNQADRPMSCMTRDSVLRAIRLPPR